MTVNFKKQTVFKGHASQAIIPLSDNGKPICDATFTLFGAASTDTKIYKNRVIIGKDESSDEIILEISKDGDVEKVILEVKEATAEDVPFDDDNVILTFALTSDTHISGSWNQPRSVAKLSHFLETVQRAPSPLGAPSTKGGSGWTSAPAPCPAEEIVLRRVLSLVSQRLLVY